jgi:hypothetical protein
VFEVLQRSQPLLDDLMARLVVEPGNHRYAAGVMVVSRVVKTPH